MIGDSRKSTLRQFLGAWNSPTGSTGQASQSDSTLVPATNGLLSKNAQYFGDQSVTTRYGNPQVFQPDTVVRSMINWLPIMAATPENYLVWLAQGSGIKLTSLAAPGVLINSIMTNTSAVAASLTPQGARLYAGFMDANGIGSGPGQVYDVNINRVTPLFAAPMTGVTLTVANSVGSGLTTAGPKNYGFVITTETGFITLPSNVLSVSNNAFVPTNATTTDASITVSMTATWPIYAQSVSLIMTTTANPNDYFLDPVAVPVPGGVSLSIEFIVTATDDFITTNWLDASQYFNQLSSTVSGTNPFEPAVIVPYGQRMCYVTLDGSGVPVVYVSEPGNPQQVSAAFGGVYLPGNLSVVTAFALGRVLYIVGPHWTYSTTDNNGEPSTWSQPQIIDGLIGCGGPFCISVDASQTYAWVADDTGFWLFSGSFPDRPISYYQNADWSRINFAQTTKIFVIDDKTNLRVHVIAPLDGATDPTHILTWDYSLRASDTSGINVAPEQVKYSLNNIQNYSLGCGCIVQNNATKRSERWLASYSNTGFVLREAGSADANPYRDNGTQPIDSQYQTALLPNGGNIGQLYQHHGAHIRATGTAANLTAIGLDSSTTAGPFPLAITPQPGAEILQQFYILSEGCSLKLDNGNTIDQWFKWSGATHYFTNSFPQR